MKYIVVTDQTPRHYRSGFDGVEYRNLKTATLVAQHKGSGYKVVPLLSDDDLLNDLEGFQNIDDQLEVNIATSMWFAAMAQNVSILLNREYTVLPQREGITRWLSSYGLTR